MSEDKSRSEHHDPSRRAVLGGGVKAVAVTAGAAATGLLAGCGQGEQATTTAAPTARTNAVTLLMGAPSHAQM